MEEIRVLDIKFLHGMQRPMIVVLFEDTKGARHVKTYEVRLDQKDLQEGPWTHSNVEPSASLLLAVPRPIGTSVTTHTHTHTHTFIISIHSCSFWLRAL
jgi:DNA damage-binding protein 1